jgi:hypothetical protein
METELNKIRSPRPPPTYQQSLSLPTHIPIRVYTTYAPPVYYPPKTNKKEEEDDDDMCCCIRYKL